MDMPDADGGAGFVFIWTIHNYNYGFQDHRSWIYEGPTFVLNETDRERWSIEMISYKNSPRNNVTFMLKRFASDRRIELTLELAISTGRGVFKTVLVKEVLFYLKWKQCPIGQLILNEEGLDAYVNNDSLAIKCRILKLDGVVLAPVQCYARTVMGGERTTYVWDLEGFGDFECEARITKRLLHLSKMPSFTIDILTAEDEFKNKIIQIEMKQIETFKKDYSTCEVFLVGADGKIAHSVKYKCRFDIYSQEDVWKFPFIRVSKILSNKKLYMPNGILCLRCEFFSALGAVYNAVERIEYGITNNQQCCNQTAKAISSGSLKDNLQRFYANEKLSDLTIRVSNKEFPVHRSILCARSEVFSAMFESDTKEAQTGVVEIVDIDVDTVSKMLLFMYTDTVGEELEYGTASSLYFAADKYEIVALRKKCSEFLKDNIDLFNVCDVLVLADMHQNEELVSAARKFIFEHSGEIMNSEKWKNLMKNQLQLASETMRLYIHNLKV